MSAQRVGRASKSRALDWPTRERMTEYFRVSVVACSIVIAVSLMDLQPLLSSLVAVAVRHSIIS